MNALIAKGSCFCQRVKYQISGHLGIFQYCHCSRCRKFTGSAFAANLLVRTEDFLWLQGGDCTVCHVPEHTKYLTTCFCKYCGSSLPWMSKNGKTMVVPAGTLDDTPDIKPGFNIFCASRAGWYAPPHDLPEYEKMPPKRG